MRVPTFEIRDRTYQDETVEMDDTSFANCAFVSCELEYAGGELALLGCQFVGCTWRLSGPARRTAELIENMRSQNWRLPLN